MKTIKVNGTDVQVVLRMGCLRTYKQLAGKDFEQITSLDDVTTFVFCCAVCAARLEKKSLSLTIDEFADGVEIEDLSQTFVEMVESSGAKVKVEDAAKKN